MKNRLYDSNNRAVIDEDGNVRQVTNYYPFGGVFSANEAVYAKSPDSQPYKYNGKELDRTHGLDWYDYGARNYDAIVPVFTSLDPLCEKYYHISPYAYCANNPVRFIDPDGRYFSEKGETIEILKQFMSYLQMQLSKIGKKKNKAEGEKLEKLELKYKKTYERNQRIFNEIYQLASSDQVYSIGYSNEHSSGDITMSGGKFTGGRFHISIAEGYSFDERMGVIGHELKHAFQFEKGELSSGYKEGETFYDKTDEYEALQRQSEITGKTERLDMSLDNYINLSDDRKSARGYFDAIFMFSNSDKVLQEYAEKNKIVFRYRNKTYMGLK